MSATGRTGWGYHQLADSWARRLVQAAGVRPGDLVLDVGAGDGALTARLVAVGARVVAVELHPARARLLRTRFRNESVVVVQADASELWLPCRPFRVVANPPFGITTALLRRLLGPTTRLVTADLVVPVQVGARWAGGRAPGTRQWGRTFGARVTRRLPAHAFRPRTPVTTAVLRVERHWLGGADPNARPEAGATKRDVAVRSRGANPNLRVRRSPHRVSPGPGERAHGPHPSHSS